MEVIPLHKHFGHAVHILHWSADQAMTSALAKMELTASQGRIMGYIARSKRPLCSRDIEEEFHLSHPTVSGLLARLEKKGFIEFRPDERDRRCKRIHMLPKGWECADTMHRTIMDNEEKLVQGFTEEEKALFFSFLERSIRNVDAQPWNRHNKEEETQ